MIYMNNTDTPTITIPVTINNETRTTEFRVRVSEYSGRTEMISKGEFAAKMSRTAAKVHRAQAEGFIFATVDEAKAAGYGKGLGAIPLVELPDGRIAAVRRTAFLRNREASLIGWADTYEGTRAGSDHNAYSGI